MTEDNPKPKYYPKLWTELFTRHYKEEIFEFAEKFPEKTKFVVHWEKIRACWGGNTEIATSGTEYFEKNPVEVLADAKAALLDLHDSRR